MKWFIRIWWGLAVLAPLMLGLMWWFNSQAFIESMGLTIEDAARSVGTRDVVYAAVLLVSPFLLTKGAVALLLVGRAAIDLLDGYWIIASQGFSAQAVIPLALGVISLVVAFLITQMEGKRLFSPSSAE